MNAQKQLIGLNMGVLALANTIGKINNSFSKTGTNKAKSGYEKAANTKKENNVLVKNNINRVSDKKPKSFNEFAHDEEKISAKNTETKIQVDDEVKGLIEVKQKNALKAAAGKRSQENYKAIKEKLTNRFADEHNIDDVWRNISLDPNIKNNDIKKAGLTQTDMLNEWKKFNDNPTEWAKNWDDKGEEYGISATDAAQKAESGDYSGFGNFMSSYINSKNSGKTLAQQLEEFEVNKLTEEDKEKYKVWQDEIKEPNRNFDGIVF